MCCFVIFFVMVKEAYPVLSISIIQEDVQRTVACRSDWHQTAGFVTLSVFAKLCKSDATVIECNGVKLKCKISFDAGQSVFEQEFILRGVRIINFVFTICCCLCEQEGIV